MESMEQLITEAKIRYPVGTVFTNAREPTDLTYIVAGTNIIEWDQRGYQPGEAITEEKTPGLLWYKGTWAEIIPTERDIEIQKARDIIYRD